MYRVLIAEDEALVRMGLKTMPDWEKLDMQVAGDAADGREAYAMYQELRPDILITDIRMPGMDGIELIRKIRASDSRIKIIILSCLDEFRLVQQAMELGVSSYILKLTAGIAEIEQVVRNVKAVLDKEAQATAPLEWLNLSLVREQVLENYLLDQTLPAADFESCARQFPLRLTPKNLRVIMLRLPNSNRLSQCHQEQSGRPLRRFVLDLLGQVLAQFPTGECCGNSQSGYCLLLSFPELNSAEAECRTGEVLEAVRKAFLKSFGAEPVFGISSFGSGFDELPDLQREAWELLREEEGSVDVQPKVAEAVRYLQEHYAENISLQSVADRLNVTPNYLGHLFVRFLERPFTDFLGEIRVEAAKRLLADPARKIYEVAEAVGIFNPSYFIRVFKKHTGLTPNEYRSGGRYEAR